MTAINLKGPGIDRTHDGHRENLRHIQGLAQHPQTAAAFKQTFKKGIVDFYNSFGDEATWRNLPEPDKIKYLTPILESAEHAWKESLIILNTVGHAWDQRSKSFALEWLFCCLVHLSPGYNRDVAVDIAEAAEYSL